MFSLMFTFFEKLMGFVNVLFNFVNETQFSFPIFVTIVGEGRVQWITIGFWELIGSSFVVFIVSWLITKIAPIL